MFSDVGRQYRSKLKGFLAVIAERLAAKTAVNGYYLSDLTGKTI